MSEGRVDRATLEQALAELSGGADLPPTHGFFGPRSFAWRMFRERALVTYAPRAVMLQYAYPPFAAASASYGAQSSDPGKRFERAVSTLLSMIFGDRERVLRDARRLFLLHDRLHGELPEPGPAARGRSRAAPRRGGRPRRSRRRSAPRSRPVSRTRARGCSSARDRSCVLGGSRRVTATWTRTPTPCFVSEREHDGDRRGLTRHRHADVADDALHARLGRRPVERIVEHRTDATVDA